MLYLITLEPLENRYTKQWKDWVPKYFGDAGFCYREIDGFTNLKETNFTNSYNFLDVIGTNIWKSKQIENISLLFKNGIVKSNDKFFFYDAWHYGIIALKYISVLKNIPIKIYGMWHAGSYDKSDLLATSGLRKYFMNFEKSLFFCIDKSFVATNFHKNKIMNELNISSNKIFVTGFPFDFSNLNNYLNCNKEDIIVFPHRISEDKQPQIAERLSKYFNIIFTQKQKLSKNDYYELLSKSKIVFSCSLHENWGIGCFESLYLMNIPLLPFRLSYKEMYKKEFFYPSYWTINFNNYLKYESKIINKIEQLLKNWESYKSLMEENVNYLKSNYCSFDKIIKEVL